ncbi:MAG: right-handed parallel beta-helix repeat-containing protein, partial [Lentisphaeria bacterium]
MKYKLFFYFYTVITFAQQTIYVDTQGKDAGTGGKEFPFKNLEYAIDFGQRLLEQEIEIKINPGKYYLEKPIIIEGKNWQGKTLKISAVQNQKVVLSGAQLIIPEWKKVNNNIWKTDSKLKNADQLFISGEKQILARYPNFKENAILGGTAQDALDANRVKSWNNPKGGFIHALQDREWGSVHFEINSKIGDKLNYTGGHQNNRPSGPHQKLRFVENIFEELDSDGEWFLNHQNGELFYYQSKEDKIINGLVEVATNKQLIVIRGNDNIPVKNITINGLIFTQTARTFMDHYDLLLRSDWGIHRGGAILIENAENVTVENCEFTQLGGNAIFISKYAKKCTIKSNHIYDIGANAICVVGDTSAVRDGVNNYFQHVAYEKMDKTPGPQNNNFPSEILVENNLIHNIGTVEKQVAGVQLQIAQKVMVRHNTIYRLPRAAINIGDGAFGG